MCSFVSCESIEAGLKPSILAEVVVSAVQPSESKAPPS